MIFNSGDICQQTDGLLVVAKYLNALVKTETNSLKNLIYQHTSRPPLLRDSSSGSVVDIVTAFSLQAFQSTIPPNIFMTYPLEHTKSG